MTFQINRSSILICGQCL